MFDRANYVEGHSLTYRTAFNKSDPVDTTREAVLYISVNHVCLRFEAHGATDDEATLKLIEKVAAQLDRRFFDITALLPWGESKVHPNVKARGGMVEHLE